MELEASQMCQVWVISQFQGCGVVVDSSAQKHHDCVRSGLCHTFKDVLVLTVLHKSIITVRSRLCRTFRDVVLLLTVLHVT